MNILTVTQLNTYIKGCFEDNPVFSNVFLTGEVSNFVCYSRTGHFYFTLKDENCQIKAVMFSSYSSRVRFRPENGLKVICRGRVSCYERDGVYQIYVEDMQPDGMGALNLAFEQLKRKLGAEGLFEESRKRPLPRYPRKIGVVTSNMGAAVQDITKILARRFPISEVVLYPAQVQGDGAAEDIVKGIEKINGLDDVDVIIVGRGGGSIEDLWAFNTELVARAVAASQIPVISAVGHETDFTICDFAADLRAATPSAAAELAVPDRYQQQVYIYALLEKMKICTVSKMDAYRQRLDGVTRIVDKTTETEIIKIRRERLRMCCDSLINNHGASVEARKNRLLMLVNSINHLNPLSVLSRGYAIAQRDGKTISSAVQAACGRQLDVKFKDGTVHCTVDEVQENE